jgi:hypothetical protein
MIEENLSPIPADAAANDYRRWEERALCSYEPGDDLTGADLSRMIQYTAENEVSASKTSCDSGNIRQEWSQKTVSVQHSNPEQ